MTTLYDILIEIRDQVKAKHPFFTTGYAFSRLYLDTGIVGSIDKNMKYIGVDDTKGDYFYIRIPDSIKTSHIKAKADCNVAIEESVSCSLVAIVKDANVFNLKDSIVNVLLKTRVIAVTKQYIDPVAILKEELKGLKESVIKSSCAKIGNKTIVRIDFDIKRTFETNNCEYDICDTCALTE